MERIHTEITASISELKANPMQVIHNAGGEPLVVLNRNIPAFYCLTPEWYETMMDIFDDMILRDTVQKRRGEKEIKVSLNDL